MPVYIYFGNIIAGEVYFEKRKPQNLTVSESLEREERARVTLEVIRHYREDVPKAIRRKFLVNLEGLERKCRRSIPKPKQ